MKHIKAWFIIVMVLILIIQIRTNKKWSDRIKETFSIHGKHWDAGVEKRIKAEVAAIISASPVNALNQHKRSAFDVLVTALEEKLSRLRP